MEYAIRALRCPGCDELPMAIVGDRQAFCGNEDCNVFTWDLTQDPATFKATAQVIDLAALVVEEVPELPREDE